jgi:hypothetical protein
VSQQPDNRVVKIYEESARIVYEESRQAYESLTPRLERYRSDAVRTLAVLSGAAAFLTFEASLETWAYGAAIAAYLVAVLLAASMFMPVEWTSNLARGAPEALLEAGDQAPPTKVYLDLAGAYQKAHHGNRQSLDSRFGLAFRFVVLLTVSGLAIVMMLIGLATASAEPTEPTRVIVEEMP